MPYRFPPDVKRLVAERMAAGKYVSEDDLLRDALRSLAEEQEDLRAVTDAVAELRAGDEGTPLREAFASIRSGDGNAPKR